jgi:ecotin
MKDKFRFSLLFFCSFILIGILLISVSASFAGSEIMKPYPLPEEGYNRMVIHLEVLKNENLNKLELLIGRTAEVDCNRHMLPGTLEKKTISGWGYTYYILRNTGEPTASTMMACPPGEEKREAFVLVRGDGELLQYNSKLPVVVYVPFGFEVRYRIWAVGEETQKAIIE